VLVKYETALNLKNVKALLRRAGHRAQCARIKVMGSPYVSFGSKAAVTALQQQRPVHLNQRT